ncbi:MAG: response regulator [Thainema sp.]
MDNLTIGLDPTSRPLSSRGRPAKPKMLVVDDEPDNLDLLYRTFRRDFQVLKAESGIMALEVLESEGEVAVIISDQRMPEMKGTEFLSKTVPQFPNTVRIILTGFTDVEDLVEAINSGQVYKYITKPWDPNELKIVVQRAAETYELLNQRTEELVRAQAQMSLLKTIVSVAREQDTVQTSLEPLAKAFSQSFSTNCCVICPLADGSTGDEIGCYPAGISTDWLANDPLVQKAIAEKSLQVATNIPADAELSAVSHYTAGDIQAHLVAPIIYRDQVIALLSLQWKQPCQLRDDELCLIELSAQQAALALISTRYYNMAQV